MAVTAQKRTTAQAVTFNIRDDGLGMMTIDVPDEPLNVINERFIEDFEAALARAEEALAQSTEGGPRLNRLIITSGKPGAFLAGADLKLVRTATEPAQAEEASRRMQAACDRLERLPVTTVAAIEGAALGGGLEVALACDYRVAAESRSRDLGLVEVQLGLIPAGGGTQRLPQLVGLPQALSMILGAPRLAPTQALRAGLVDQVVHPRVLLTATEALASKPRRSSVRRQSLLERSLEVTSTGRGYVYKQAAKAVREKTGDRYQAPFLALDAIREGRENGTVRGYDAEATNFGRLSVSSTTRNLIDIFLESNELKREQASEDVDGPALSSIGIVGAGLMGAGIAQAAAMSDMRVRLRDVNDDAVAAGLARTHSLVRSARRSRRIDRYEATRVDNRVSGSTGYSGFASTHLVIEAAAETLTVKRQLVSELEGILGPEIVIGTNTSALPIHQIASGAKHPERIVGIHFFSPVHKMPLIEVVRGPESAPSAVQTAIAFGRKLGKHVVAVGDGPGFYTSRVLGSMMAEAVRAFEAGADIQAIDRAMADFGFPVGPMVLMDEVGLDVSIHVAETLSTAFSERLGESTLLSEFAGTGRTGKKSGTGFYRYEKGKRIVDPGLDSLHKRSNPRGSAMPSTADIQERLSLVFVNEAAHCLSDGIVASARDGDLASVFGLGFPPFLGGPFRYVDMLGISTVNDRLRALSEEHGPRFTLAPVLLEAEKHSSLLRESSRLVTGAAIRGPKGQIIGVRDTL